MPGPQTPQFDKGTQLLLAEVELGFDVKDFLRSKVGRYLLGRAVADADEAMEKLKLVDPTDSKTITALQNDIHRADSLERWLEDAVVGGKNAEAQIKQQEEGSDEDIDTRDDQ